jgi:hypothetical protein
MAAGAPDGPSRPLGVELGLGGGILVVTLVAIGIATVDSLGALAVPYFLLSFLPGLLAWVALLIIARRLTRERPVGARVAASTLAALAAIAIDAVVVLLVIAPLSGYWGLYVVFVVVDAIVFLVAALVAAFVVHLSAGAGRRSRS